MHQKYGYWLIAVDRTQWKGRNLFMVTVVWGTHALPLYWELLDQVGNSDLKTQQRLLKTALRVLRNYPVLVIGDREFHSPKLAEWLDQQGVYFALRQKKDLHFQLYPSDDYQVLKDQGFRPGQSQFYLGIRANKGDGLGPFNLAVYWKRKYRNQGSKAPWYILTNLPTLKQTLAIYRCRWGIEQFFKDCKTGGYHLEDTKVNDQRFLALVVLIVLAYSLTTMLGQQLQALRVDQYAGCLKKHLTKTPYLSNFSLGVYGQRWIYAMEIWAETAFKLIALKPHKRLHFQRGLLALSLMKLDM